MTSSARRAVFLFCFAIATNLPAQSGTPAPMKPLAKPDPRLAAFHAQGETVSTPSAIALSPDGTLVAWTLRGRDGSALYLTDLSAPAAKRKMVSPGGSCSSGAPVWSSDSKTLAYTAHCAGKNETAGQEQIYVYSRATGESRQLTHLKGIFQQVKWAPDGRSIAFLFVEDATRSAGALAAIKPWSGVIGEEGVEVQGLYGVDVGSGNGTWLSPRSKLHVYEFDWAPDSREVTYVAAKPPGENNWWVAKLYTQTVGNIAICGIDNGIKICKDEGPPMGVPKVVFDPATTSTSLHGLQIAVPRWSPDCNQIAFIGGLMSDQGSTGGDVWVLRSTGGDPVDITPGIDGSPTYLSWTGNDTIGFVEDRRGHTLLTDYVVNTRSKDAEHDLGEVSVGGGPIKNAIGISTNGMVAFVESGHNQAPEIFAGPFAAPRQLTHLNAAARLGARVESVEWTNDGFNVQGWLTYPKNYDAAKKYPMIVDVHGGPSATAESSWGAPVWAELGYFLFQPNPRGSFGQGERFTAANRKDFGYGDLRDILAGMDTIEHRVSIDTHREGLMGWSYGGFMTMFAVTQTQRFRAAVAGAGIADWKSYYGENSIDQWMVPFFGSTVYDDPAIYAKSSAIEFIKSAKTPTLVVVGDRDGECPAPQSFEFWHALRAQGVKTQLVVFPNEGHHFVDSAHIRDLEARQVAWFATEMPAP